MNPRDEILRRVEAKKPKPTHAPVYSPEQIQAKADKQAEIDKTRTKAFLALLEVKNIFDPYIKDSLDSIFESRQLSFILTGNDLSEDPYIEFCFRVEYGKQIKAIIKYNGENFILSQYKYEAHHNDTSPSWKLLNGHHKNFFDMNADQLQEFLKEKLATHVHQIETNFKPKIRAALIGLFLAASAFVGMASDLSSKNNSPKKDPATAETIPHAEP